MIQQDTTQLINESIRVLSSTLPVKHHAIMKIDTTSVVDTLKSVVQLPSGHFDIPYLFKTDTQQYADSTMMFDSFKSLIHLPRGFEGLSIPSLPQTENWVFAVLIFLFFIFVLSLSQSYGTILETAKTFFQVKERSSIFSNTTINDFRHRFFLILFSTGVLSLYAYLITKGSTSVFTIKEYGYFLIATSLYLGLKSIIIDVLGYIFIDPNNLKMAKISYFNIISFLGITLFPLLIFDIYAPVYIQNAIRIISLIICLIGCILIIIKLFQIFLHKIVASFYILLYLCTLEFLPLIVLFRVYNLII
jgi:hypothetical protein